ncbi:src kinase-associated phosphoprotein 1 [Polymixia lowei]
MGTISDDIRRLLEDCELFVADILQEENLSNFAREARDTLLNNFRVVYSRNPQEFPFRSESRQEDSSDDNQSSIMGRSAPSDDASVASDYQDEGSSEFIEEIPSVAAQDLSNISKQGYLEKKRRDHSFFSMERQKRWCVLNNTIFYYFGSEKDKQQKGSFYINDYSVELIPSQRKDKKSSCFMLSAPGQRTYQFTASNHHEAKEWVEHISFVLKDLSSTSIPFDDDEEEEKEEGEEEEETYDDIAGVTGPPPPRTGPGQEEWRSRPGGPERGGGGDEEEDEDDIYEVLPDEDFSDPVEEERNTKAASSSDYSNYYQGLWKCDADEPDELSFNRGDLINIISKEYNIHGWWVGELNGTVGIVPKDFLHPAYIL